ncbi:MULTISPECIES: hypothetical protein [Gammaproteobacteria]|uniref:hypothetical protein n=1 Tax=Gammaproteobacteria TaxID=1236 RepID=UPI000DD02B5D|nr:MULTISPECIES: hypothetical protein [Gammaproteobacteria]RTE86529.1 hypothetical protein DQX04_08205 [Aliidiomarina sp. B3213]TCZ90916.1 hypothetical protein EYQ95_08840 [Lysobacter sp. N42]
MRTWFFVLIIAVTCGLSLPTEARQKGGRVQLVESNFEYIIQTLATADLAAGRCQHAIGSGDNAEQLSEVTLATLINIRDSSLSENVRVTLFNGTLQRARDPQFQQTFQASYCEPNNMVDLTGKVLEINDAVNRETR